MKILGKGRIVRVLFLNGELEKLKDLRKNVKYIRQRKYYQ